MGVSRMTKKTLLEILKDVDDDAIIYVSVDDDMAEYHECLHIKDVSDIVNGDDVQNEITLCCY